MRIKRELLFIIPLSVGLLVLFRGIFLKMGILDIDYLFQQIPFRSFAHQEIVSGRLPFVYPYSILGIPLISHGQIGIFFPLTFFTLLLKDQFLAYFIELALLFLIGFIGEYFFASLYFKDKEEKIIASLYFAFSPFVFAHIIHLNLLIPFMLLPYSLYIVKKGKDNKSLLLLLPLIFSLVLLALHPQGAMIHSLIVLFYALLSGDIRKNVGKIIIYFSFGVLMAGIQVMPFLLLRLSGNFASYKGLSWMAQYSFDPLISLPLFFIPLPKFRTFILNPVPNGEIYLYITGFLGIFTYLFLKKWRYKGRELLIIIILGLFLMIVKYNPFYTLISKVPLLNTVRGHMRWWGGILPFIAIIVAMGIHEVSENNNLKRDLFTLSILPLFWFWYFVLVKIAAQDKWFYLFNVKDKSNIGAIILWSMLFIILLIRLNRRKWVFIIFLIFEIILFGNLLYPYVKKDKITKVLDDFQYYRNSKFIGVPLERDEIKSMLTERKREEVLRNYAIYGTFFHGNFSYFLSAYNVLGYVAPALEPEYTVKTREIIYEGFSLNKDPDSACRKLKELDVDYLVSISQLENRRCISFKERKGDLYIYSVIKPEKCVISYREGRYILHNNANDSILDIPIRYVPGLSIKSGKRSLRFKVLSDYIIRVKTGGNDKIVITYRPVWVYYGLGVSIIGVILFIILLKKINE